MTASNQNMASRAWHIVGQGAIGSFCAANLQLAARDYCVIGRQADSPGRNFQLEKTQLPLRPATSLSQCSSITNLLVPLKAYDVLPFLHQALPYLAPDANIVLCHNGMGTLVAAKELLPAGMALYFCTTSNGVFIEGNKATLAGRGPTYWNRISSASSSSENAPKDGRLTNADFEILFNSAEQEVELDNILWRKLLINSVINPLTAIYDVPNGALLQTEYQNEVGELIKEFVSLAERLKLNYSFDSALDVVTNVMQGTANNTSSMLQDTRAGRPTEIDFINGYLVTQAKDIGLTLPHNEALIKRLKN